jgi:hypothetical protein
MPGRSRAGTARAGQLRRALIRDGVRLRLSGGERRGRGRRGRHGRGRRLRGRRRHRRGRGRRRCGHRRCGHRRRGHRRRRRGHRHRRCGRRRHRRGHRRRGRGRRRRRRGRRRRGRHRCRRHRRGRGLYGRRRGRRGRARRRRRVRVGGVLLVDQAAPLAVDVVLRARRSAPPANDGSGKDRDARRWLEPPLPSARARSRAPGRAIGGPVHALPNVRRGAQATLAGVGGRPDQLDACRLARARRTIGMHGVRPRRGGHREHERRNAGQVG